MCAPTLCSTELKSFEVVVLKYITQGAASMVTFQIISNGHQI